jgi:DNA (cytosine-5)-methyltransferase 1
MKQEHKFKYNWTLKDAVFTKDKGTVFSCFACGGGSTMGYKLAGFDVIGHNDIDKKMIEVYKQNHNPKFSFLESITTFAKRKDLPEELYSLDILDGSPPCSSFSMAGAREKDWGKEKKFREGQELQVLDTLFFDFIELAKELQPKIIVAENVAGLMMGNAKEYVKRIYTEFEEAGYRLKIEPYLLDASNMGVPQKRKRVFFIALRIDLASEFMESIDMFQTAPKLDLKFNEKEIIFKEIYEPNNKDRLLTGKALELWNDRIDTDIDLDNISTRKGRPNFMFNHKFLKLSKVCNTITSSDNCCLYEEPRYRSKKELCNCGSYPTDYNFLKLKPEYLIGMSVPPVMTAQIASEIYNQWLSKINNFKL